MYCCMDRNMLKMASPEMSLILLKQNISTSIHLCILLILYLFTEMLT